MRTWVRDRILEFKFDVLGDGEVGEPFAALSNLSLRAFCECGKFCTFGLRHIEDVNITEIGKNGFVDCCGVFAGGKSLLTWTLIFYVSVTAEAALSSNR
jgi:hypothetical protein